MVGWIKLHRSISEKGWFSKPEYLAVWIHLLVQASHEPRQYFWNGSTILLAPGQFVTGRSKIAAITGVHESKVERILKCFESEQQIEQRKTSTSRLISICNWLKYQESEQQFEQQINNDRTTSEQQVNTKQELKNVRIKEINTKVFIHPTELEVENYIFEKFSEIEIDKTKKLAGGFFDYYSSNGWKIGGKAKMKDWQAAVRNWIRNDDKFKKTENGKSTTAKPEKRFGRVPESSVRAYDDRPKLIIPD